MQEFESCPLRQEEPDKIGIEAQETKRGNLGVRKICINIR
jgi:hypothetical protein